MKKIEIIFKTYDANDETLEPLTKPMIVKKSVAFADICQVELSYFVHVMSMYTNETLQEFIKEMTNAVQRLSK